jgi:hypothetical protein
MTTGDDDRARILLRRTAFLGGALAAIGCTTKPPAEPPGSSAVVAVPESDPEPGDAGIEPPPRKADAGRAGLPSFDVPGNIGPKAREQFQRFFDSVKRIHPLLDDIETLIPEGCSVLDASCQDRWRRLASKQNQLREIQTFMYSCPGSSADAKLYAEREKEHLDYINERQKKINERLSKSLERDGKAGDDRYARIQEEAYSAAPYPCLSVGCEDW